MKPKRKPMKKMSWNIFTTLRSARKWVKENKACKEGLRCPCCNGQIKTYTRKLNSSLVVFIIALHKLDRKRPNDIYFHAKEIFATANRGRTVGLDYCVLKHYKFIEAMEKDEDDTRRKTSGYWRMTDKGRDFLRGKISVPSHVMTYMENKLVGFTNELIFISDIVDEHFDYEELMNE